jgi:hypothetical protein
VKQPKLTIGQVAERDGINSPAVRLYERAQCHCSSLELCALFARQEAA